MRGPTRGSRRDRGIALPAAIFVLVVLGALVAGAFVTAMQEQRLARQAKPIAQAFGVAEIGLAEVVRTWEPATINGLAAYPADSLIVASAAAPAGTGSYDGVVYRLNDQLFLLDVTGADTMSRAGRLPRSAARQRLGLLARIRPLRVDIQAALTSRGAVGLQGSATVNGADEVPPRWSGCAAGTDVAGVRTTATVTAGGTSVVTGTPPVWHDPNLNDSTLRHFGDLSFADLARRATVTLPAGTYRTAPTLAGGECDRADPTNWGGGIDASGLCAGYFPLVFVAGDLVLEGGEGQGILLVAGDVAIPGDYRFFGVVVATGAFRTTGGDSAQAYVRGAVLAERATLGAGSAAARADVGYSSCAIARALTQAGDVAPLRSRGWAQLY